MGQCILGLGNKNDLCFWPYDVCCLAFCQGSRSGCYVLHVHHRIHERFDFSGQQTLFVHAHYLMLISGDG